MFGVVIVALLLKRGFCFGNRKGYCFENYFVLAAEVMIILNDCPRNSKDSDASWSHFYS